MQEPKVAKCSSPDLVHCACGLAGPRAAQQDEGRGWVGHHGNNGLLLGADLRGARDRLGAHNGGLSIRPGKSGGALYVTWQSGNGQEDSVAQQAWEAKQQHEILGC